MIMMHKIKTVVICTDLEWGKKPFEKAAHYSSKSLHDAYGILFKNGDERNLHFVQSNFDWYDKKKRIFKKGWAFDKKQGWFQVFNIKANFVFDKSPLSRKYLPYKKYFSKKKMMINHLFIEKLCSDKLMTYKLFKSFVPMTVKVNNEKQFLRKLKKIRTEKIVVKPEFGSSAVGVQILNKRDAMITPPEIKKDYILQEFVDCKKMKKFGSYGVFDMRVVAAHGKIIDQLVRVSKKGVLTSNVSTGGKMIFIKRRDIPKEISAKVHSVDRKISKYGPRIYAADFMIDSKNRVWLIELNSKPGFFYYLEYKKYKRLKIFCTNLIEGIKKQTY